MAVSSYFIMGAGHGDILRDYLLSRNAPWASCTSAGSAWVFQEGVGRLMREVRLLSRWELWKERGLTMRIYGSARCGYGRKRASGGSKLPLGGRLLN